jgi:hypothetical protein
MILRTKLLVPVLSCMAASPVIAQTAPAPPPQAKHAADPNEIVCEREKDLGSRLATTKVCHTRAEWADLRHQDRQMIDRAQTLLGAQNGH